VRREAVIVECYSGHTYAERPVRFLWEGSYLDVEEVAAEWREPGARHFRVRARDDRTFDLCYDERYDGWTAVELR
jgi:hypothetical protein